MENRTKVMLDNTEVGNTTLAYIYRKTSTIHHIVIHTTSRSHMKTKKSRLPFVVCQFAKLSVHNIFLQRFSEDNSSWSCLMVLCDHRGGRGCFVNFCVTTLISLNCVEGHKTLFNSSAKQSTQYLPWNHHKKTFVCNTQSAKDPLIIFRQNALCDPFDNESVMSGEPISYNLQRKKCSLNSPQS